MDCAKRLRRCPLAETPSKSECQTTFNDVMKTPKGSLGFKPGIVHVLALCLAAKNITIEQFDQALAWMQGEQ
jgi:hypothetical protein